MFISNLEMIGFKSFASRTKIEFRSGMMSVVGPNGCGKTNIVDAIRWVLGEQRTSALRADRMEAVIFNGTQFRRPLGMAEVTLTIENDKKLLPSPFSEVAITRRLYRSGESEYLINRTPCRLRDIHDMFTDTGFGHSAYSIIELQMVEGIISGPSEARRNLIEEAAGVAKFKARRNSAERRLISTSESLIRLEDVYSEIEKRYRSLKRQASRARRYQNLARALQLRILVDLAEERVDILNKRHPLEATLQELENQIEEVESAIEAANRKLTTMEARELTLIDRFNRSQNTLKQLDRREAEMNGEIALTRQRITFLKDGMNNADQYHSELNKTINNSRDALKTANIDVSNLESKFEEMKDYLADLEVQFADTKTKYESTQKTINIIRREEENARQKLASHMEGIRSRKNENYRLNNAISKLNKERENIKQNIEVETNKQAQIQQENAIDEKRLKEITDSQKKTIEALNKAHKTHADVLSAKARAAAEVEAAKTALSAHHARASSSIVLPETLKNITSEEKLTPIGERIECQQEYRAALGAALRSILDAFDRPDEEAAFGIAEKFQPPENAVLRFPMKTTISYQLSAVSHRPNIAGCLYAPDLVTNQDDFGDFLRQRLSDVIVVPDKQALRSIIPYASEHGLRLVTLAGECFEPDGVLYAGRLDPDAMQIGWSSKLKEFEHNYSSAKKNLTNAENEVKTASNTLKKTEIDTTEHREKNRELEDKIIAVKRCIESLDMKIDGNHNRLHEIDREVLKLQQRQQKTTIPDDVSGLKKNLEKTVADAVEARKKTLKEFQAAEKQRIRIAETRASVSAELSRYTERINTARNAVDFNKQTINQASADLATHDAKITNSKTELDRVNKASENIVKQLEFIELEKKDTSDKLNKIKDERNALRNERDNVKNSSTEAQTRQKDALKQRSELEGQVIGLRERLREVDRRLEEETHVQPSTVGLETAKSAISELEAIEYADLSAEKLRTRINSLGPINMVALDELKPVEERYRFLTDQKQDLENGIEVLEETIDRINSEARRRFRETFDKVNLNFQELFRTLFEGGEARIHIEGDDPLEADIKISVTPTGKKLQALSMLSGGEKALTAIALIFAIYEVRPSPFCVLDEIDAPLDDANVMRFNKLVNQYAQNTQYMIVTHNKRTMSEADSLVGVTLGGDGTSHLVSVKLEKEA